MLWTFLWKAIASSGVGFKLFNLGIKYKLTTEILCLLSRLEVFCMAFHVLIL